MNSIPTTGEERLGSPRFGTVVWLLLLVAPGRVAAQSDPTKDVERRNGGLSTLKSFTPVCFSPDGRTLLLARFDPVADTEAVVWDLDAGRQVTGRDQDTPLRGMFFVSPVVFSRDGKRVAGLQTGLKRSVLKVWDAATWKERAALAYEEGCNPVDFSFSSDGDSLGAGFLYGSVRVWDLATGKTRAYYPEDRDNAVYLRALSPNLKLALVQERTGKRNRDGTVHLWDLASDTKRVVFEGGKGAPRPAEVMGGHFSQDGKILVLSLDYHEGGSEVIVWQTATGKRLTALRGHGHGVPSPDGRYVAIQTEEKAVRVLRLP
jgi:WD40 repeat protein